MSGRPIVIAHRGASGYLPEHTLEAKALAYGLGADFLEQDVVATRDHELVVLHDIHLDDVTDVAAVFPSRCRADGHFYVVDFDLEELRALRVTERRRPGSRDPVFPERFPVEDSPPFRIVTLEDELRFIRGLNRATGRDVGIYPEIKEPRWHADHGIDLGRLVLAKLEAFGYRRATDRAYVQCFDAAELRRLRSGLGTELPLVQLIDSGVPAEELASRVTDIARYANAIGPHFSQLVEAGQGSARAGALSGAAHAAGLAVHPYTFRADRLPPGFASLDDMLTFFFSEVRVDGVFCDQPDVAVRTRDRIFPPPV
jgi:glycerophosphoryl diester phosphodiesterase